MDHPILLIVLIIWILNQNSSSSPPPPPVVVDPPPTVTQPPSSSPPPPISISPVVTPFQSWFNAAKGYRATNSKNQKLPVLDYYFPAFAKIGEQIGQELQDNQRGKAGIKGSIYWGTILGLEGSGIFTKQEAKQDFQASLAHLEYDAFTAGKMTF